MATVLKFLSMASLHAVLLSLLVIIASAGDDNNNGVSKFAKEERLLSTMIGIEGIILYKSGSTIAPLQGKLNGVTGMTFFFFYKTSLHKVINYKVLASSHLKFDT